MKESKEAVYDHFTSDGVFSPPPAGTALASAVGPQRVHYSTATYEAVYDYNGEAEGDLSFMAGDIIRVRMFSILRVDGLE